jgi:hypothetical protein
MVMLDVTQAVTDGRAAAEARMLDICEIRYRTGRMAQDPDTLAEVPVYAVRFTTPCRVKAVTAVPRSADAAGRESVTVLRELHIPVGSPTVAEGDEARMTFVHSSSDPTLAGAVLVMDGPAPGSQTTARRLRVSEVVA